MAIPEIVAQARQIDVADLVGRYVKLEKVGSHEWAGECPKCGGRDRLHVKTDGWFCRQCRPIDSTHGWHDAVDFMQWVENLTFQEATERLTNQQWPERKTQREPSATTHRDDRQEDWFEGAARMMRQHQLALPGSAGAAYLRQRGLQPDTWAAFGLGFADGVKVRDSHALLPAVALPWYRGGKLTAIRYRLLEATKTQKISSYWGSKFGSVLFGAQGLPSWVLEPLPTGQRGAEQYCTLVLCEGEINAMSIWQVAHHTNLHVMSMGSESSKISVGMIEFAARYGVVIVWLDKVERAKEIMAQLPGAFGFGSPEGKDANDLLQAGTLGGQLVALRWQAAHDDNERQRLVYDLWDGANEGGGLDNSTMLAYRKLCEHMGRHFDLVDNGAGLWVTPCK